MDGHSRGDRVRRSGFVRHIIQRDVDGRTHAVHREMLHAGIRIAVPRRFDLIRGGIVALLVGHQISRGIARDLRAGLFVHMMHRHKGRQGLRRFRHIRRHGDHRQVQRIGRLKAALAVHLHAEGHHAVHRRGVARDGRAGSGRIGDHCGILNAHDALYGHAKLQGRFLNGSPVHGLLAIQAWRYGHGMHRAVLIGPLQRDGRQRGQILRQRRRRQRQLRREEQHARRQRRRAPDGSTDVFHHIYGILLIAL